jgi:hypothetical protein
MLGEPDLDFTRLTRDAAGGGQVEVHGHRRTTSLSLTRAMLTHLPRHRKNDPLWRKHRLQPRTAFSRFPPIRSLTLEGQLRVEAVVLSIETAIGLEGCESPRSDSPNYPANARRSALLR